MNVDPQYVLGLCYLDTNRFDDARHAFAAQYEFLPDSAPAYLLEGRMLLRGNTCLPRKRQRAKRSNSNRIYLLLTCYSARLLSLEMIFTKRCRSS